MKSNRINRAMKKTAPRKINAPKRFFNISNDPEVSKKFSNDMNKHNHIEQLKRLFPNMKVLHNSIVDNQGINALIEQTKNQVENQDNKDQ